MRIGKYVEIVIH